MPANVTHLLIAHKALQKLKTKGVNRFAEFANLLDDISRGRNYKAYVNLGSLGPDLFYYADIGRTVKDIVIDGFVHASAMTAWSYQLHSHRANEFCLKLIEIVFKDVVRKNGKVTLSDYDIRKLAYIAGHLTHIAADQIIHPVVNSIAGPFYQGGENARKHRECEIFQDYFLYEEVYRLEEKSSPRYYFLKQAFYNWIDCVRGVPTPPKEKYAYLLGRSFGLRLNIWSLVRYILGYVRIAIFKSTPDWFLNFLQRGFVETYGSFPSNKEIKDSVDYLRLSLLAYQKFGPYKKMDKEYRKKKDSYEMYQEYVKEVNYIRYYRLAVELSVIYLIALYEVFFVLKQGRDFTNTHRKRFLRIVSDADLSSPLQQMIFEKAHTVLRDESTMGAAVRIHSSPLLTKTKFLTKNRIFKAGSDKDIVKG